MSLDPKRLRRWFAAVAIFAVGVSAVFYLYARMRVRHVVERTPEKLGINIQQSTQGFTLSKSEAGRTIFTVHASRAVQYKEGGRAELHNVSILVYGRRSDRFDQIYGDNFEYDPRTGDILAHGEVSIDLEGNAQGPVRVDQATPVELKNPIHVKTSGLVFNEKTGAAATKEKVEFRVPQASGTAMGASYDSKANALTLGSDVHLETVQGATVLARHGVVTQNPRRVVLDGVHLERASADIRCDQATLLLRDDNSISRVIAMGNVQAVSRSSNPAHVESARAEFTLGPKDLFEAGELSGGVKFEQAGLSPFQGSAGRALLQFGPGNVLSKVTALEHARVVQEQRATANRAAQSVELDSERLEMLLARGRLEHAVTGGEARLAIQPHAPNALQGNTVITAGRFEMGFGGTSRLESLHGEPDAKVVSSIPGQPEKVSTSRTLDVAFSPDGQIADVVQRGDVRYVDAERSATADQARYTPNDTVLVLTGSPRWVEGTAVTTAQTMRFNRTTGVGSGDGQVKTTYRELKQQQGSLLSSAEPIHVTADKMNARRDAATAVYSGSARLWQGTDIVEAPTIEFDRSNRVLTAEGARQPVSTVFVQDNGKGKVTPVTVTASHLRYSDGQRRAVFQGSVFLKSADGTVTADTADIVLKPAGQQPAGGGAPGPAQVEEITAQGNVVVQQPSRKAVGNKLVYTAAEGKYVMTGGSPSIFDAERGVTRGDSLTFYNRGDTVLVGSQASVPTVTQTHTSK